MVEELAILQSYNLFAISYLHLFLRAMVSLLEYPPLSPAPSARISSSSGVAPPVIRERIRVSAFWLK